MQKATKTRNIPYEYTVPVGSHVVPFALWILRFCISIINRMRKPEVTLVTDVKATAQGILLRQFLEFSSRVVQLQLTIWILIELFPRPLYLNILNDWKQTTKCCYYKKRYAVLLQYCEILNTTVHMWKCTGYRSVHTNKNCHL